MCYVLALLMMHVEGGPASLLRLLSFQVILSPSSPVE